MRKYAYKPFAVISSNKSATLPVEANKNYLWMTQSAVVDLDNYRWRSYCRSFYHLSAIA